MDGSCSTHLEMRNHTEVLRKLERKFHFVNSGVDGRTILKKTLKK